MEGLVGVRGRSVLVTGHTGFKGGWLAIWLASLGAEVHGYSLGPPTEPSLFDVARVGELLASDTRGDVANQELLSARLQDVQPDVVIHFAAQPLVTEGYRDPIGTLTTNVIGTANVLEATRRVESVQAVVVAATDKVYGDDGTGRAFRETDPLAGHDPYSASKAAAELVVASYRSSFFDAGGHRARIASVRAGNVVGGGDWSADRLVPDCFRAFEARVPVRLRHPNAVRPWQHVVEPLSGYLALLDHLLSDEGGDFARAWNFGPDGEGDATVAEVANRVAELWGDARIDPAPNGGPRETGVLRLDSSRAMAELGWKPQWSLEQALQLTVAWQKAWRQGSDMQAFTLAQIAEYAGAAVR